MLALAQYREIIDNKPIHIATVTPGSDPNLAVASDVKVLDDSHLLVSANEMVHTQENIQHNPKVVITAFDKDWKGVIIFGVAKFYEDGEYYDLCNKTFFGKGEVSPFEATKPKGAIVVEVIASKEYI